MRPDISEFSYGYALTDELINWYGTKLTAAPVFPSLYQEGQAGGGYDVKLNRPGVPLFLQFKLSHCMVRNTANEVKAGLFSAPFYRMHIRPSRHSNQHEMLLDLEKSGNDVWYVAPAFHTPAELNKAYLARKIGSRSLWIRPSIIGSLPDAGDHHVAFDFSRTPQFCSKPSPLDTRGVLEDFQHGIEQSFHERSKIALREDRLYELASTMETIGEKKRSIPSEVKEFSRAELHNRHPLERIAFYSHFYLDLRMFIVSEVEDIDKKPGEVG